MEHGAKAKVCSSEGCKNQAVRKGVDRHGIKRLCRFEHNSSHQKRRGVHMNGEKIKLCIKRGTIIGVMDV